MANQFRFGVSKDGETVTLRKFKGWDALSSQAGFAFIPSEQIATAVVADVETTGLNSAQDKIIEIALVSFTYDRKTGDVIAIGESYEGLQDPGEPLSAEIQKLTGLTDEMLAGKSIDWNRVNTLISSAGMVIAHNAGFDRPFIEKKASAAINGLWGCSLKQVDWPAKGFGVQKLEILSLYHGFFTDAHRALNDVNALLYLLSLKDIQTDKPYLHELVQNAQRPFVKVVARNSPFELKDDLKRNGYKWDSVSKTWYKTLFQDQLKPEIAWLETAIYHGPFTGYTQEIPLEQNFRAQ